MNYVLAPFVQIQEEYKLELKYAYNTFSLFMWRYLPTFYSDEDFYSL